MVAVAAPAPTEGAVDEEACGPSHANPGVTIGILEPLQDALDAGDRAAALSGLVALREHLPHGALAADRALAPLMRALRVFEQDWDVQASVLDSLQGLAARSHADRDHLGHEEACELTVAMLRAATPLFLAIQAKACTAISSLALDHSPNAERLLRAGSAPLLIELLGGRRAADAADFQRRVLEALLALIAAADVGATVLAERGAAGPLIGMLMRHLGDARLQQAGVEVLRALAETSDEQARAMALEQGGCSLVVQLLDRVREDAEDEGLLAKGLCDLVSALVVVDGVSEALGQPQHGCCAALLSLARRHAGERGDAGILAAATYALYVLAWNESNRAWLVNAEDGAAVDVMLRALRRLMYDAHIQAALFFGVGLLVLRGNDEEAVAAALVQEGLGRFEAEPMFQSEGCALVGVLALRGAAARQQLWARGCPALVVAALRAFPRDVRVQVNGWIAVARLADGAEPPSDFHARVAAELLLPSLVHWGTTDVLVTVHCIEALVAIAGAADPATKRGLLAQPDGVCTWLVAAIQRSSGGGNALAVVSPSARLLRLCLDAVLALLTDSDADLGRFVEAGLAGAIVGALAACPTDHGLDRRLHTRGLALLELLLLMPGRRRAVLQALLDDGLCEYVRDIAAMAVGQDEEQLRKAVRRVVRVLLSRSKEHEQELEEGWTPTGAYQALWALVGASEEASAEVEMGNKADVICSFERPPSPRRKPAAAAGAV